jgi:hypothetical protein
MTKFESDRKSIPYGRQLVFGVLSNMENLDRAEDFLSELQLKELTFDRDACSFVVESLGPVRVEVTEREEPQIIRWAVRQLPIGVCLQVELLAETDNETSLCLTIEAEMNFLIKQMISKHLQQGVLRMADALAQLPYGEWE